MLTYKCHKKVGLTKIGIVRAVTISSILGYKCHRVRRFMSEKSLGWNVSVGPSPRTSGVWTKCRNIPIIHIRIYTYLQYFLYLSILAFSYSIYLSIYRIRNLQCPYIIYLKHFSIIQCPSISSIYFHHYSSALSTILRPKVAITVQCPYIYSSHLSLIFPCVQYIQNIRNKETEKEIRSWAHTILPLTRFLNIHSFLQE